LFDALFDKIIVWVLIENWENTSRTNSIICLAYCALI